MVSELKMSANEIRSQVNKICQSDEIRTKLQLCKLLRYVVDEALAGRSENLKGYTIALDVFGKGNDFDPDQDPIVRIHAGRLRRMLKLYYLQSGTNDPIVITSVPEKAGFLANFLIIDLDNYRGKICL